MQPSSPRSDPDDPVGKIAELIEAALPVNLPHGKKFELTDLGNAARFCEWYGDDFRHCPQLGGRDGFLAYDGRRWSREAGSLLERAVHKTVRNILGEACDLRQSGRDNIVEHKKNGKQLFQSDLIEAWAKASQGSQRIGCIPKLASAYLDVPTEAFDADPYKVNVANGTLHVRRRGEISDEDPIRFDPHGRGDLITKLAPVDFDPAAECPHFDRFLEAVQPDAVVRRFLLQWFGYSLIGDTSEQKLAFLYGKGRNGKTTLVDAVAMVAGEYGDSIPIETFLDQGRARRGGDASPDLAGLAGVRCLRTSEPEKGAKLAEALIKLATGGEPIKARHLNRDFFVYQPQFKLTISGNYRPRIDGTDEGIWRRVMLVPFEVTIRPEDRDASLGLKLASERSGILNRLLDGLRDWLENGLSEPPAVSEATARYREDSDPLGRFLALCVRRERGARAKSSDMHRLHSAWAKSSAEREWSPKGLAGALKERGFVGTRSNGMWWLDCELLMSPADFDGSEGETGGYASTPG